MPHKTSADDLETYFPYLSEDTAEVIHKRLTADQIRQLVQDIKEMVDMTISRWAKSIESLPQREQIAKIREEADKMRKP